MNTVQEQESPSRVADETARVRSLTLSSVGNIPPKVRALSWLCYRFVPRDNGKLGKPPTHPTTGRNVAHDDPKFYLTFDQAMRALKANRPGNLAGIGIRFTGEGGLVGIDLDNCLATDGSPLPWAQEILSKIDTYTEISPSGKGLRLFGNGAIPEAGGKHGECEAYQDKRFLTVTGNVFRGRSEVKTIPPEILTWFWTTHIRPAPPEEKREPPKQDRQDGADRQQRHGLPTTPAEVISLAGHSANGDKFRRLMAGDLSDYDGDQSAADLALCCVLAFYCGRDPALVDATFRQSGLMRPKWDEKRGETTYGQMTIAKAIEQITKVYTPGGKDFTERNATPGKPDEWTTPICFLEKITLPRFPSEQLPMALRGYVEAVADCRQVPVDLPAFLAIAVAATAAARKYRVYIGGSHSEPLNIWTATALPPGSRKSDTFDDMLKPLYIEQSRLSATAKPAIDAAKAFQKINEKRMEFILNQIARERNQEKREELEREYSEMGQTAIKVPSFPCLVASGDTTPEAAAALLEEQNGRIAIMDTEGGLFSVIAGRYDSKGEPNMDVWLKMHSGDELSIHRRNRPPIEVSKPAGTVAITVQPTVIKDLATKKDFRARGLLGRFLYAIPESLVGTRLYQNKRINQAVKGTYLEAIRRVFAQPEAKPADEHDRIPHHRLYLRGAALEVWKEFYNDTEKRQSRGGDLEGIADWASKCAGAVARLAGIFHVIETGGDPNQNEISVETMGRAYEIGRLHLIEHAKAAYGLMSMTADTHLARDILAWLAAKGKTVFTVNDFWMGNRSKAKSSEELLPGFEILVDRGIIREIPARPTGGRTAKHRYEVNPACKACFRCLKND